MREYVVCLLCLTVFCILVACTPRDDFRWDGKSQLESKSTLAELQQVANDASLKREKRVEAIFTLFANHVKLPASAAVMAKVFAGEKWLEPSNLGAIRVLGGWIPVDFGSDGSVFRVYLFPDQKGWSDSVIYLRLSGDSGRPENEAIAFMRGDGGLKGDPELLEFALCFPPPEKRQEGRIERFSIKGIHVYEL